MRRLLLLSLLQGSAVAAVVSPVPPRVVLPMGAPSLASAPALAAGALSASALATAPEDRAAEWLGAWDRAQQPLAPEQIRSLERYKVVFVNGLLADSYANLGGYFDGAIKELRDAGADVLPSVVNTQVPSADNVPALARAIESSDKPVLLITHSKGGLDTLHALIERPKLRPKVKAWLALQAPFYGSPVADWVLAHRIPRFLVELKLKAYGGSLGAIRDLAEPGRREYMARHAAEIAAIAREIAVFSLSTWKEPVPWRVDTVLKILRDAIHKRGRPNDGLVTTESSILPGSDHAVVEGIDHLMPVTPLGGRFDRARFIRAIAALLLDRAAR